MPWYLHSKGLDELAVTQWFMGKQNIDTEGNWRETIVCDDSHVVTLEPATKQHASQHSCWELPTQFLSPFHITIDRIHRVWQLPRRRKWVVLKREGCLKWRLLEAGDGLLHQPKTMLKLSLARTYWGFHATRDYIVVFWTVNTEDELDVRIKGLGFAIRWSPDFTRITGLRSSVSGMRGN